MNRILLILLLPLSAVAQTTYPVLSTTTARTIVGGITNLPHLNSNNVFTGTGRWTGAVTVTNTSNDIAAQGYGSSQQTLSYSSGTNLTVDASKVLHFVSLTNTAYFAQPSNLTVGSSFTVILKQDSTGTRAVTFNTNYWKFPGGSQPSITTNANAYSVLSCIADPYGTNVFSVSTLDIK